MNAATVLLVKVPQAQRLLVTGAARQGPPGIPGPPGPLDILTDVDAAGAIQDQVLTFDPATGGEPWKPKTITELLPPLGAPGGIATLDANGLVPIAQMPAVAINDTFPVNSQAEMLALVAQRGDTAIRLDTGQTFILAADDPTILANWKLIVATAAGLAGGVLSGSYPNPGFAGSPSFTSDVPTNPILSLLAQPAQTGNFLEARDSLNNTVASISSNGAGSFASGTTVGGASVVVTTDPRLSDTRPPTGPAGGVLAGTYPNPAFAPSPTFTPSSTTTAGLIVQGLASQTADLQQWRNSAGTILGRAAADGGIYGGYFQSQSGASYVLWSQNPNALLVSTSAAYNPLVVRGTTAQTGDLQQWQNSAASPLARVESGGGIRSSVFKAILGSQPYVDLSTQDVALWNFQAATNKVVIRGFASQSANLQEWQDSTGAVVGSINAFGNVVGLTLGSAVGGKAVLRTNYDTGGIGITTAADANKGLVVRRNSATQAQSLLEIQDEAAGHLLTVGATGQLLTAVESHFAAGTFSDPVSGSSAALKIGGGNQTWGIAIQASGPANSGLLVKGAAAQTADLQQWRNSAGTVLAKVDATGEVFAPALLPATYVAGNTWMQLSNSTFTVLTGNAANVPLAVKGYTSQATDLQQWQDVNGVVLSRIRSDGAVYAPVFGGQSASADLFFGDTSDTGVAFFRRTALFNSHSATSSPVIVRAFPAQSANLQEWQDNTGAAQSRVTSAGYVYTPLGLVGGSSSLGAQMNITALAPGNIGIIIRAAASQTADIAQWQNSAGTAVGGVASSGDLYVNSGNRFITPDIVDSSAGAAKRISLHQTGVRAMVMGSTATDIALVVQGAASQSGDLQQWQTSTGSVRTWITAAGSIVTTSTISASGNGAATPAGLQAYVSPGAIGTVGLVVQAFTGGGQTSDLQQWQNSAGSVLSSVRNDGRLVVNSIQNVAGGTWFFVSGDPSNKIANSGSAASRVLVVQGAASQSGPLTEWQDSSGAVLGQMLNGGSMRAPSFGSTAGSKALLLSGFDTGGFVVSTVADANKGLAIRRNSTSATANLFETQSEAGVPNSVISPFGAAVFGGSAVIGRVTTYTASATTVGLVLQGAASQTADLQQWQNSAASVLAKIDANGNLVATTITAGLSAHALMQPEQSGGSLLFDRATAQLATPAANAGKLYFRAGSVSGVKLVALGPNGVETTIADNL